MGLLDMFKKKAQDPQVQQKVKGAVQNQMNRRQQSSGGSIAPTQPGYPWMPGDPMYGQLFWPDQSFQIPGDYDGDGIPDDQEYGDGSQQDNSGQGNDPNFDPNDSGPAPDGQDYSNQGQDQYSGDGSSDTGGSDYSNDSSSYDQGGYSDGGSGGYSDGSSSDSGGGYSDYGSSSDSYDSGSSSSYDSGGGSYDSGGGGDSGGF